MIEKRNGPESEVAKPYALMFHHMTDGRRHPFIQGSLTGTEFHAFVRGDLGHRVLSASDWLERYVAQTLEPMEVCITFDDALLSQFDIARPILDEYGISAIWFVYSSVFEGVDEPFEIYRYFRNVAFSSVDEYYSAFLEEATMMFPNHRINAALRSSDIQDYLSTHDFYSFRDRQFRYIRDIVLSADEYDKIMNSLMNRHSENVDQYRKNIWMRNEHLRFLRDCGHIIGLHSYSHPVNFRRLTMEEQISEYHQNAVHLTRVLGSCPEIMAHPSNSYNETTLRILRGMGVKFGFRSDVFDGDGSDFEIQRMDHILFKRMIEKDF